MHDQLLTVIPGFYLRQLREPSLTDPSVSVLICDYLTIYSNGIVSLSTVLYMDGDSCVSTTADPLLIQSFLLQTVGFRLVNLSIPLSDDTRSDFLGAFTLNPTDNTASRYVHKSIIIYEL